MPGYFKHGLKNPLGFHLLVPHPWKSVWFTAARFSNRSGGVLHTRLLENNVIFQSKFHKCVSIFADEVLLLSVELSAHFSEQKCMIIFRSHVPLKLGDE